MRHFSCVSTGAYDAILVTSKVHRRSPGRERRLARSEGHLLPYGI